MKKEIFLDVQYFVYMDVCVLLFSLVSYDFGVSASLSSSRSIFSP